MGKDFEICFVFSLLAASFNGFLLLLSLTWTNKKKERAASALLFISNVLSWLSGNVGHCFK